MSNIKRRVAALAAVAREMGANIADARVGGRHVRITVRYQANTALVVVPQSPSDWRGERNSVRDLKHAIWRMQGVRT